MESQMLLQIVKAFLAECQDATACRRAHKHYKTLRGDDKEPDEFTFVDCATIFTGRPGLAGLFIRGLCDLAARYPVQLQREGMLEHFNQLERDATIGNVALEAARLLDAFISGKQEGLRVTGDGGGEATSGDPATDHSTRDTAPADGSHGHLQPVETS